LALGLAMTGPVHAADDLWSRDTLTGQWGGLRTDLAAKGVTIAGTYTGEIEANPIGGLRRGPMAEGLLDLEGDVDFGMLAGWGGLSMHVSALQNHGHGLSNDYLIATATNIEAVPATRLWQLWLQQKFFHGAMVVRGGQITPDTFVASDVAAAFPDATFGWPIGMSSNLPSGGGTYPLAVTGVRIRIHTGGPLTWTSAVYNGDTAPPNGADGDPAHRNHNGFNFDFSQPPLYLSELAYRFNRGETGERLPSTVKVGAWYHGGIFADQHYDTNGVSLGAAASNGVARNHRGDWGGYAVIDSMMWRNKKTGGNVSAFARIMGAPPDRNAIPWYGDVGITDTGAFTSRPNDVMGIAFGCGWVGAAVSGRERDALTAGGVGTVQDYEATTQLVYRADVTPWWTLVPNVTYVSHPNAGASQPDDPSRRIPDALIFGLRTVFTL
jgi:porin